MLVKFWDNSKNYLANAGGSVANVRNPVCPGCVGGAEDVKTFNVSLGCFIRLVMSLSVESSSSGFWKEKTNHISCKF